MFQQSFWVIGSNHFLKPSCSVTSHGYYLISKNHPKQNILHFQVIIPAVTEMQNCECEVAFLNSTYLFKRTSARIFSIMISNFFFILPICHWVNNGWLEHSIWRCCLYSQGSWQVSWISWIMAKTMTLGEVLLAHQDVLLKNKNIALSWMKE